MSYFLANNVQCNSLYEDAGLFKPDNGMGRKMNLRLNQKPLHLKNSEKQIRNSLRITDFSMIKALQDAIPSPNQDALVPQLEEIPPSLVELKGCITATIDDLEKMNKCGPEGPLSLLGNAPNLHIVNHPIVENDFEQSSELHLLEDNEPSVNIEELLRINGPYSSSRKNSEPFSISSDQDNSPASVFSGTSSPAHFFEQTMDQLPTTLDLTSPSSSFGFMSGIKGVIPKIEDNAFGFDNSSMACSSSTSGMFLNGDSNDPSDNRYVEMRRKNNIASKRSRQTRREKEIENEMIAKKLTDENADLKRKVQALEQQTEQYKKYLILTVMKKR